MIYCSRLYDNPPSVQDYFSTNLSNKTHFFVELFKKWPPPTVRTQLIYTRRTMHKSRKHIVFCGHDLKTVLEIHSEGLKDPYSLLYVYAMYQQWKFNFQMGNLSRDVRDYTTWQGKGPWERWGSNSFLMMGTRPWAQQTREAHKARVVHGWVPVR